MKLCACVRLEGRCKMSKGKNGISGYTEVRFKVSKFLYRRLKTCANRRGCTMSEIARTGIINFINEYENSNKTI